MIEVYFTWYRCWCCFDKKILMIGVWQPLSLIYANQLGFTDVWFSNSNLSLIRPWLHCGKTRGQIWFYDLLIMMLNSHAQRLFGQLMGGSEEIRYSGENIEYFLLSLKRGDSVYQCVVHQTPTHQWGEEDVNVSNKYESISVSQHLTVG